MVTFNFDYLYYIFNDQVPAYRMGGQQSTEETGKRFEVNHPKFQNTVLSKNNETIITKIPIENQKDFQNWKSSLTKMKPFEDDVLLLPKKYNFSQKEMCGNSGFVEIQFDNHGLVLEDEIVERGKCSKYFEEKEIWYLLYNLILSSIQMKNIDSKIGDVRTKNIFISESTGNIKVGNIYSWPCQVNNYEKTIFNQETTYLAPEEIKEAKQGRIKTKADKYQAQAFSIGVTVLQTAILKSSQVLYTEKKKSFHYQSLQEMIDILWKLNISEKSNVYETYSTELKTLITGLCQINAEKRLSTQAIYSWLKPFDSQIINLKPFKAQIPHLSSNRFKQEQFYAGQQNIVRYVHEPTNHQHFLTQQKNKFSPPYSQIKPSQDSSFSFKYSFTASEPKTSIYKSVNPPTNVLPNVGTSSINVVPKVGINMGQNVGQNIVPNAGTNLDVKYIPQYPITQIPTQEFKRESEKIGGNDGQSNLNFLKKIDEQLRISQQNYK